eukprot:403345692
MDRQRLIETLKTSLNTTSNSRPNKFDNQFITIQSQQKALISDQKTVNLDTYEEFKVRALEGLGEKHSQTRDCIKTQNFDSKIEEIKKECLICLSGVADAVILKCGHGGLCFECGKRMSANKADQRCHLCRKKIKLILKIDLERISGQFVPIQYYLDLRGPIPEIKQIKKSQKITTKDNQQQVPVLDIESKKELDVI